jgi:mRNA interferase MazF
MSRSIHRGEIWSYRFHPPDKRRPVLVITRQDAIPLLHTVMVAPVTSTIRGSPGEVLVGVDEGLKKPSAVNLDHVQTVQKARLTRYIGRLGVKKMRSVCHALALATGCEP